jgi:hypothetical protein
MIENETRIYASHSQFYVQDGVLRPGAIDEQTFWTKEASARRVAVGKGILGIGTGSYDFVKVRVEHHDSNPHLDLGQWDHVAEAGLDVETELILVMGCLSPTGLFFEVKPGHYRVRACQANLADSEQEVPRNWTSEFGDWYLVQFWPSHPLEPQVLKQR